MNERIRELSAIAKNLATDEAIHLSRVHNRTLSLDEEQEIFTTKFAELIVRECIDIAKDVNRNPYLPDEEQARQIIKNITKHFGVDG